MNQFKPLAVARLTWNHPEGLPTREPWYGVCYFIDQETGHRIRDFGISIGIRSRSRSGTLVGADEVEVDFLFRHLVKGLLTVGAQIQVFHDPRVMVMKCEVIEILVDEAELV